MILTTWRHTKSAIEYAALLSDAPIGLYDRYRLADLAEKARIRLVTDAGDSAILSFPASDAKEMWRRISSQLKFQSSPGSVEELLEVTTNGVELGPYVVRADIYQEFATSVGMIHRLRERDLYYIFDATNGDVLDHENTAFLAVVTGKHAGCPSSSVPSPVRILAWVPPSSKRGLKTS